APWLCVHAMPSIAMLAFCAWLTRRWIFTSGIPAGTDMLGFISRAGQNAPGLRALSIWNPNSFGGLRQFTLESGLGLMTKLTGDPVVTVKLALLATVLGTAFSCYFVSWRWFGRTSAALVAALLYVGSQESLAHMASGHLNVSVAIALAPLALYLWVRCVDDFSIETAALLTLTLSAMAFSR